MIKWRNKFKFKRNKFKVSSKYKKRVIASILLASVISVSLVNAVQGAYSSQSGTKYSLGSPILSADTFTTDDWNKWEMLCFGVFMSNFCEPLVDTYESAFTDNDSGSKGEGQKALEFGSGNDINSNAMLKTMTSYCVDAQKKSLKPLKVRYVGVTGNQIVGNLDNSRDAQMSDLIIRSYSESQVFGDYYFGAINAVVDSMSPFVVEKEFTSGTDYKMKYIDAGYLAQFYTTVDGVDYTVFDESNGWDIQVYTAWLAKVFAGSNSSKAVKKLQEALNNGTTLALDGFGNICLSDGTVVIPACTNQYLTDTKQYNLLNSVALSDLYADTGEKEMQDSATGNGGLGITISKDKSLVLYQDTDTQLLKNGLSALDAIKNNGSTNGIINADTVYNRGLLDLVQSDLAEPSNSLPFKVSIDGYDFSKLESIKISLSTAFMSLFNKGASDDVIMSSVTDAAELIGNAFTVDTGVDVLSYMYSLSNTSTQLFNSHTYIDIDANSKDTEDNINRLIPYVMNYIESNSTAQVGNVTNDSGNEMAVKMANIGTVNSLYKYILSRSYSDTDNTNINDSDMPSVLAIKFINSVHKVTGLLNNENDMLNKSIGTLSLEYNIGLSGNHSVGRVAKVYTLNNSLKTAMKYLNISDGAEFASVAPCVYLTYLKWYGVTGKDGHSFNEKLFKETSDILNTKGEDLFSGDALSQEEKQNVVLNNVYKFLNTDNDGAYRRSLIASWLGGLLQNWYDGIAKKQSYTTAYGNVSESISNGFLNIEDYSNLMLTSFIYNVFETYSGVIMAVAVIIIIITSRIKSRKLSWTVVTSVVTVVVIALFPSIVSITPYICTKGAQSAFKDSTDYWELSESITNSKIEEDISDSNNSSEISMFVDLLATNELDRTIMVKSDISKKVVSSSADWDYEDFINLPSAQWAISKFIQQFSSDDGTSNYVYTPLGDLYDNMSLSYWLYNDADAVTSSSYLAKSYSSPTDDGVIPTSEVKSNTYYLGYRDTSDDIQSGTQTYKSLSRTSKSGDGNTDNSHTVFYMLNGRYNHINLRAITDEEFLVDGKVTYKSWDKYGKYYASLMNTDSTSTALSDLSTIIDGINNYNKYSTPINQSFGYLWTTENPGIYFYQSIKDTFGTDISYATLMNELLGYYDTEKDTGKNIHRSFMRYANNGEIRDFLDLEELFTNVMPYLYSMQLAMGGDTSTNGLLGDTKMSNYSLYSDNYGAWLYRCNWVSKLLESTDYNKAETVKYVDSYGNKQKVTVEYPIIPQSYPQERPMVFSRAQMVEQGLSEEDLTYVEQLILNMYDELEKEWTLLLNYTSVDGMTKEVMYRHMAIKALLLFNNTFAPDNGISAENSLYPSTLDLRSISYDSAMKLMMLNSSKDSSYIYSDTMKSLLDKNNVIAAIFLFLSALNATVFVPFVRKITLSILFYITAYAFIRAMIVKDENQDKLNIIGGYIVTNVIFCITNMMYFKLLAMIIGSGRENSVLKLNTMQSKGTTDAFGLLGIIVITLIYIMVLVKTADFIVSNRNDLGFDRYASMVHSMGKNVTNAISKGNRIRTGNMSGSNLKMEKDTTKSNTHSLTETIEFIEKGKDTSKENSLNEGKRERKQYQTIKEDTNKEVKDGAESINAEIEKGKRMADRNSK